MKEQKNIERLFREKFKDFEAIPPHDSWDIIAARLNKKKKKRIVPFWFKLSGIAASFLIIGTLIWNNQVKNETILYYEKTIVLEDSTTEKTSNDVSIEKELNEVFTSTNQDKIEQNSSNKYNLKENNQNGKNNLVTTKISEKKIDFRNTESKNTIKKDSKFEELNHKIVENSVSENNFIRSENKNKENQKFLVKEGNALVNQQNSSIETIDLTKSSSDKTEIVVENKAKSSTETTTITESFTKNNIANSNVVINEILNNDSTLVAKIAEEKNPLEELLLANEEGKNESEKEEKRNKWAISSVAAPVYFNSLAEGSSIDEQFSANAKSFSTTLSYGIAGSYMISNKLSVRAGINNINLSYNTNNVAYQTKFNSTSNNVPALSRNANGNSVLFMPNNVETVSLSGDIENVSVNNLGALKQDISYIEMPLEMSYTLVDAKFGIELIGGMSTLFLNNNSISLVANNMEMDVGKANNLNTIHFSSNIGLGLKYRFMKNFNANFQPMFKYQINSFSENSSNFKPYFIGLYSGISFSF